MAVFACRRAESTQSIDNSHTIQSPPMAKRSGLFRYQLLQSNKQQDLHLLLDKLIPVIEKHKLAKKVRWSLDIDPVDVLRVRQDGRVVDTVLAVKIKLHN